MDEVKQDETQWAMQRERDGKEERREIQIIKSRMSN